MAIQGINPIQPAQTYKKSRGGKAGGVLGGLGGLAGGISGGIAGFAAGGLPGAIKGATMGAAQGAGAGMTLGGLIDPARTKTVTQAPQSMGQIGGGQSLAQKYKMSEAGRLALEGFQVAKAIPEYQEYQEPLAMAIMQDIAANNKQRMG